MIKMLVAFGMIATLPTPALADSHSWQVGNDSFHIYYTDLDMTTTSGRATLLKRAEGAAARLCQNRVDRADCIAGTMELVASNDRAGTHIRTALRERDSAALAVK